MYPTLLRFSLPICLLVLAAAPATAQTPADYTFQGRVEAADAPGPLDVEVWLLPSDPRAPAVYAERHQLEAPDGVFNLRLGAGEPIEGQLDALEPRPLGAETAEFWVGDTLVASRSLADARPSGVVPTADAGTADLRVFDGDGAELGRYAGEEIHGASRLLAHRSDLGLTLVIHAESGDLDAPDIAVLYDEPGCVGRSFVARRWKGTVFARTDEGFLTGTATAVLPPRLVQSRRDQADGRCTDRVEWVEDVVPVTALAEIDLDLPFALPVHVGVVGR